MCEKKGQIVERGRQRFRGRGAEKGQREAKGGGGLKHDSLFHGVMLFPHVCVYRVMRQT